MLSSNTLAAMLGAHVSPATSALSRRYHRTVHVQHEPQVLGSGGTSESPLELTKVTEAQP